MAGRRLKTMLTAVAIASMALTAAAGKSINVGGSSGWVLTNDYVKWAKTQSFAVGDTLVFKFDQGSHDVAAVTKAEYDACDTSKAATTSQTEPPVSFKIASTDPMYFVCTVPGHCSSGQKLAVTVSGGGKGGTASIHHPDPKKGDAPPPSSAPAKTPSVPAGDVPPPDHAGDAPPPAPAGDAPPPAPAGDAPTAASADTPSPASGTPADGAAATAPAPAKSFAAPTAAAARFSAPIVFVVTAAALLH